MPHNQLANVEIVSKHGHAAHLCKERLLVQVLPLAFIAKSDEDSAVGTLWGEVWEEGTTSLSAALRMYLADLRPLITAGGVLSQLLCLGHQARV